MADNEIRNPAKAYFKWKLPVIAKSEDDWNFWNTEDKYNRTLFIGYNDTTTPHVASLFLIEDGKAIQAVGDDVLARIAQMEVNVAQALADIQTLIDRVNAQQLEISNLQQECERILAQAADAVEDAQTWAEGSDEDVADLGGEHSAKGWAKVANDIIASGLPSDATFEHITVTGNSKFGQDPDRENQPGLEIEGTGEIQAYRTVNMLNGATVSYDETVEMPWSDSSNKVPNTKWVQSAVQHGTIDPNSEITCKKITTTTGGLDATLIDDNITNTIKMVKGAIGKPIELKSTNQQPGSSSWLESSLRLTNENISITASNGLNITANVLGLGNEIPVSIKLPSTSGLQDKRSFYVGMRADLIYGARVGGQNATDPAFWVYRDAENAYAWIARFFVTPTVPDIGDTSDSSSKVPNTKWVQAAIASGGGSGAVSSVNGKTGEVVLDASDVGAITEADATTQIATALEPYAKTADVNTSLEGYATADALTTGLAAKQDKLTAGEGISISDENVISCTVEPATTGVTSVNGKTGKVVLSAADVGAASTSELASYVTTDAMNTELTNYATTSAVDTKLTAYQPKLIAGEGISISDSNIISATGGGAVESVNGKTGTVVLSGEDINVSADSDTSIATTFLAYDDAIAAKQDAITANTALTAKSVATNADVQFSADASFTRACVTDIVTRAKTTGYATLNGDEIRINGKNTGTALTYLSASGIFDNTAQPAANTSSSRVGTTKWVQSAIDAKLATKQDALTDASDITVNSVLAKSKFTVRNASPEVKLQTDADTTVGTLGVYDGALTVTGSKIVLGYQPGSTNALEISRTNSSSGSISANFGLDAFGAVNCYGGGFQAWYIANNVLNNCLSANSSGWVSIEGPHLYIGAEEVIFSGHDSETISNNRIKLQGTGINWMSLDGETKLAEAFNNGTALRFNIYNGNINLISGKFAVYEKDSTSSALFYIDQDSNLVSAYGNVTLGSTAEETSSAATSVWVRGDAMFYSSLSMMEDTTAGLRDTVFWHVATDGSATPGATYEASSGEFSIPHLVSSDPSDGAAGIDWDVDSRNTSTYGLRVAVPATFNTTAVGNLTGGIDKTSSTGQFDWYLNTTTDYNKFNIYSRYYTTDAETGGYTYTDTQLMSAGGSPDNHSTWIDFTANYLSFKGAANFGETGVTSHTMNFNGNSTFKASADFYAGLQVWYKPDATSLSVALTVNSTDGSVVFDGPSVTRSQGPDADANNNEVPTTAWVRTLVAGSGTGGGTVESVNGKTGAVVLAASDILTDTTDATVHDLTVGTSNNHGTIKMYGTDTGIEFYPGSSRDSCIFANKSTGLLVLASKLVLGYQYGSTSAMEFSRTDSSSGTVKTNFDFVTNANATMHKLTVGDGYTGAAFTCNTNASFAYEVHLGWQSGRFYCMRDEYNWLFDFNRSANVGERIKFNDDVRILSTMPDATNSSTTVPTTAWVQAAIDAKIAKPTVAYTAKTGEDWLVKTEECTGGSLCTVHVTATTSGLHTMSVPEAFSNGVIVSSTGISHASSALTTLVATLNGTTLSVTATGANNWSAVVTIYHAA